MRRSAKVFALFLSVHLCPGFGSALEIAITNQQRVHRIVDDLEGMKVACHFTESNIVRYQTSGSGISCKILSSSSIQDLNAKKLAGPVKVTETPLLRVYRTAEIVEGQMAICYFTEATLVRWQAVGGRYLVSMLNQKQKISNYL